MLDWFAMGGHGFFIWSSYGMLALALVIELVWLRQARKQAVQRAIETRHAEATRRPRPNPSSSN
jgi:heme exporter protein CcmD